MAVNYLPTTYQEYIALSRYARFNNELGRRETWSETVDRLISFWRNRVPEIKDTVLEEIRYKILNLEVMPSMRSLMTAGPALERDETAGYNCSFAAIAGSGPSVDLWDSKLVDYGFDEPIKITLRSPIIFDEFLYILMCGTGAGFSIERQFISEMPTVGKPLARSIYKRTKANYPGVNKQELSFFDKKQNVIYVADSKYGWASALRIAIVEAYNGNFNFQYDVSDVRKEGETLKTFGGRASGPQALVNLFENVRSIFKEANGRKLTSLESHDLMCYIAEAVIVGGVRRCLPGDALVTTVSGDKCIKDVEIGDIIETGGEQGEVVEKVNSGVQKTIKIKHYYSELECTPNHRVMVFDREDANNIVEIDAGDIKVSDRLVWDSFGYIGEQSFLPDEYSNVEVSQELAWLFGLIQGDGYIGERSIEIASANHQVNFLEKAKDIIYENFGIKSKISAGKGNCSRLRTNSKKLASWLYKNVKKSKTPLVVPLFIKKATQDVRGAFLAGLFDADGRVRSEDNILEQCTTIYEGYAKDIIELLRGLGIAAKYKNISVEYRRERGVNANDYSTIYIRGNTNRVNWAKKIGGFSSGKFDIDVSGKSSIDFSFTPKQLGFPAGWKKDSKVTFLTAVEKGFVENNGLLPLEVLSIESSDECETYDIEVSNVHRFTSNGVVVHNSALISLSNLSDQRMRYAKSGDWCNTDSQRSFANNSVAYTDKPDSGTFMREWLALYDSKSGERGIFNREAAKRKAESINRDSNHEFGVNPCFRGDILVHTKQGHFRIKDLVEKTVDVWDGYQWVEVDNFRVTGYDQPTYKVTLYDGSSIVATPYHKFILIGGEEKELQELIVGDELMEANAPIVHGSLKEEGAYLKGFLVGDGTTNGINPLLWMYQPKYMCEDRLLQSAKEIAPEYVKATNMIKELVFSDEYINRKTMKGLVPLRNQLMPWVTEYKNHLPFRAFNWDLETKVNFLAGLFDADGTANDNKNGYGYQISSISLSLLEDVQLLLKTMGIRSKIQKNKEAGITDFGEDRGGVYKTKAIYRLFISQVYSVKLSKNVRFERLKSFSTRESTATKLKHRKVVSIDYAGIEEEVYCCTVPTNHRFALSACFITGNCSEILLRDSGQMCNLTSVVVKNGDTFDSLKEKIRVATILGTLQATLTNFVYLSSKWKENCEEERLLGVSMSGTMDNPVLSKVSEESKLWLRELRKYAREVNAEWANKLGINQSAAITCNKPEGTSSQLVGSASGIHPRYSPYYIRRVRADDKDPLAIVMKEQGFPSEIVEGQPSQWVFSFPQKSPEGAVFRDDRTAIEQLEYWLMWYEEWCDHNPSVTIYVKEHEWLEVGAWVYKNFDKVCGVSFLPHTEHSYKQAPYEECTEEEYEELLSKMPKTIDYEALSKLEITDKTSGTQEYACVGGACELI